MLAMAKAKLVGFLEPGNVANRYPNSDSSLAARYARTIAAYQKRRRRQRAGSSCPR